MRVLIRRINHCPIANAAQDMYLLALEAAHHHGVVGGDKYLRLPCGCIKSIAIKRAAVEPARIDVTQYAFDIVEVAQLPDRV